MIFIVTNTKVKIHFSDQENNLTPFTVRKEQKFIQEKLQSDPKRKSYWEKRLKANMKKFVALHIERNKNVTF